MAARFMRSSFIPATARNTTSEAIRNDVLAVNNGNDGDDVEAQDGETVDTGNENI